MWISVKGKSISKTSSEKNRVKEPNKVFTEKKAHRVICSVPCHSLPKTGCLYVLSGKEHLMNKAQGGKRGYRLQIAGRSMAVYKALIDGSGSKVLCRASNNCVNNHIIWILSNTACNTSLFGAVCTLGKCTCYSTIAELENVE